MDYFCHRYYFSLYYLFSMSFLENKFFYFILLFITILYPLLQSFEWRIKYHTKWKKVFVSAFVMMLLFIPWDIWFTKQAIWSFNKSYTIGLSIFLLPIEEWLFFIIVPFSCVFIYEVLNYFFTTELEQEPYRYIFYFLSIILAILSVIYADRLYTLVCFSLCSAAVFMVALHSPKWMGCFFRTYLVSLIPFLLINGFLTGSFTDQAVVNYHSAEIIGLRILNIPIEDTIYNLLMLLVVIATYNRK